MTAVVIGAGLAGAVAAARLAAQGVATTIIADRPGATIFHGGGWLLGLETLTRFALPAPQMDAALEFIEAGLPELALTDGPFTLLDVDGVPRDVDMAPQTHAAGHAFCDPAFNGRVGVVDLAGLGHPFAEMCPWLETITIAWPEWPGAFGRSFAAAAARLDADPAEADRLIAALKTACSGQALDAILLPPVLGLTDSMGLQARLQAALGMPVAEALDTLPSTPGLRLDRALTAWLARLGVTRQRGRVTAIDVAAGTVAIGDATVSAKAIVMATGGVLPGGLTSDQVITEPLVGLRITPELPVDVMLAVRPDRPYDADLFRAGLPVDEQMRPIGYDGEPVHLSLFAAGDLLAGPDSAADGCGSGVALLSGFLAADAAVAYLKRGV
ncbi:MAG: anaerobic glycerol-3-phosphate dehydrogenase [Bradymonadia bacterium]|jgi:anaerobic glycerol-3-phosphate dehydrogenase